MKWLGFSKKKKAESKSRNTTPNKDAETSGRLNENLPTKAYNPSMTVSVSNWVKGQIPWIPFYFALLFAFKIINEINPTLFSFSSNIDGKGSVIFNTPIDAPIIYEKGLVPHAHKDDRVPISVLSDEYDLNDPNLPKKLTGLGSLYIGNGRCTASLLGRNDFIITAAHCLPKPSKRNTAHIKIEFYSLTCKTFYTATKRFIKTDNPRRHIDLDYAFLKLDQPACADATPFQAVTLTDEAAKEMLEFSYPLLSLSTFEFEAVRRHAEFPKAWEKARERYNNLEAFGVFCRFSKPRDNIGQPKNALTYYTQGCDTFSGNSGGPLLVSLDGGKSYKVIATLFGHTFNGSENLFPRVKGVYAKNLESFYAEWTATLQ